MIISPAVTWIASVLMEKKRPKKMCVSHESTNSYCNKNVEKQLFITTVLEYLLHRP